MGIIARQGIKRSIISASGVLIGGISTILVYPLAKDAAGYAQFIFNTAMLLSLLLGFGSSGLVIKYFPEFKAKKTKGYLGIIISFSLASIIIVSTILFILKDRIFELLKKIDFKNLNLFPENLGNSPHLDGYVLSFLIVFCVL